eukprot:TRINITY_DN5650_c0_g3_i1.p1 TRINITY_DN5650_c0_g3~~TRINITY_DN5650_c0_g3_i1.p1  ORF type:complete len:372 (+),score=89.93 TRINITY_DN5650_c0_g3_i1:53-1168(+)
MDAFIEGLPKAELHVHIEGCLEPQLMMDIAERNGMLAGVLEEGGWSGKEDAIKEILLKRENYEDLSDFLNLYNTASGVLRKKQDFYDLMVLYITRAKENNIRYSEIFFDPQSHLERGVTIEDIVLGLSEALSDNAATFKGRLIPSILRDWKVSDTDDRTPLGNFSGLPSAFTTLQLLEPLKDHFIGLGMSNAEISTKPSVFQSVFDEAKKMLEVRLVSHCGEEGMPVPYITEALALGIERVDHGVLSLLDTDVLQRLVRDNIPLTTCPLSNVMLKVNARFFNNETNIVRRLVDSGARVTINSDDPAYFRGYLNANFKYAQEHSSLSKQELVELARNSFSSSFMSSSEMTPFVHDLQAYARKHGCVLNGAAP